MNINTLIKKSLPFVVYGILPMYPTSVLAQDSSGPAYSVPFNLGGDWEQFDKNCSQCHGKWAGGTEQGPPLIHKYYLPGHHDDYAFLRAIKSGSRAHHWNFGDMPPVPGVKETEATQIVAFIRWLQQESGLLK